MCVVRGTLKVPLPFVRHGACAGSWPGGVQLAVGNKQLYALRCAGCHHCIILC